MTLISFLREPALRGRELLPPMLQPHAAATNRVPFLDHRHCAHAQTRGPVMGLRKKQKRLLNEDSQV